MPPNAITHTLNYVWNTLDQANIRSALLGGLALAVQGLARSTQDIDLIVAVDDADKLATSFQAAGIQLKGNLNGRSLGLFRIVQWQFSPPDEFIDVDIDILIASTEYQHLAIDRAIGFEIDGVDLPVRVLTSEDLILHKAIAGRMIDLWDIRQLMQRNNASMEMDYLTEWSNQLGVYKAIFENP